MLLPFSDKLKKKVKRVYLWLPVFILAFTEIVAFCHMVFLHST